MSFARPSLRRFRSVDQPVTQQRRLRDTRRRRRRLGAVGLALAAAGLAVLVLGVATNRAAPPPATRVNPDGVTPVPQTRFYQNQWVLFGTTDDPRRVPTLSQVGCQPVSGLTPPVQPADMTAFGSRVVEGQSISALAVIGHADEGAVLRCAGAGAHEPLWLLPSSEAPPFTPTGIIILGVLLMVAGALVHPATVNIRWPNRSARDGQ